MEEAVWAVLADLYTELNRVIWDVEGRNPEEIRYRKWVRLFEFIQNEHQLMETLLGEKGHIKLVQRTTGLYGQKFRK